MTTDTRETASERTTPPAPPWGWGEAVVIHLAVLMIAFAAQWRLTQRGMALSLPHPWPWVLVLGLVLAAVVLGALRRERPWMRWLSGVRFAIVATAAMIVLSIAGTLIVQEARQDLLWRFGLRTMFASVPFLAVALTVLTNLSTVLGRRLCMRRPGNLGFLLNHLGLLLVMVAMIGGAPQFIRATVHLTEGMPVGMALDDDHHAHPLGATLSLQRFAIAWYPPQLKLADMGDGDGHHHNTSARHVEAAEGTTFDIDGITGRVVQFLPHAAVDRHRGIFIPSAQVSGLTAALIEFTTPDGKKATGWIAAGEELRAPIFTLVRETKALYMTRPMPKTYRSTIVVTRQGTPDATVVMEVNKPLRLNGWWLYQSSYAPNRFGGMDSILQAVQDPVLPLVYAGLLAMLAGTLVTFWLPRSDPATPAEEVAA